VKNIIRPTGAPGAACSLLLISLLAHAGPLHAQGSGDPMAAVKDRYAAAAYEEAIGMLDQLKPADSDVGLRVEIEKYRALCFLAVGRKADAERAVERLVGLNPSPAATQLDAAPWVRTAFAEVRRRVLPDVVSRKYEDAKAAVLARSYTDAGTQLKQVLALLDDPDLASTEEGWRNDLRTLTRGYLDLVQQAVTPVPRVEAPPPPGPLTGAGPTVPPVAVREEIPPWPAELRSIRAGQEGVIQLVVDEKGAVASAVIVRSIHPVYDQILLQAARANWQYKPATKGGTPISYTKLLKVVVGQR
jgi:hypothetical protein